MGGRASKQKGSRRELEVVKDLQAHGVNAKKTPLSGALGGEHGGDVIADESLRLEVKARRAGSGWSTLNGWLGEENDALVLIQDRAPWRVFMPWDLFVELMQLRVKHRGNDDE